MYIGWMQLYSYVLYRQSILLMCDWNNHDGGSYVPWCQKIQHLYLLLHIIIKFRSGKCLCNIRLYKKGPKTPVKWAVQIMAVKNVIQTQACYTLSQSLFQSGFRKKLVICNHMEWYLIIIGNLNIFTGEILLVTKKSVSK